MPTNLTCAQAYIKPELYQKIVADAKRNHRTISNQIGYILQQYYADKPPAKETSQEE